RDGLAEHTGAEPARVIALRHHAAGGLLEAVLHLRAGILLERAMPRDGLQSVRADNGARLRGAEHQVIAKSLADVGDEYDVVRRRALGEHRHLRLYLLVAAVGAARPGVESIGAFLDDLRAEAGGGPAYRTRVFFVGRMLALDQEPATPLLPEQILGERVGAHRVARGYMEQVRAAACATELIVARPDVENDRVAGAGNAGDGQQISLLQVGEEEALAGVEHGLERR